MYYCLQILNRVPVLHSNFACTLNRLWRKGEEVDGSNENPLLELWDAGICPNCGNTFPEKARVGSGKKSEGGFCSLSCYAEYYKAALSKRHLRRLAAAKRHQN